MTFSRQDDFRTTSGRSNQKARTRAALLEAATDLVREGRPPSMADAAERALISVATAYRYFPSAEDLWWEASTTVVALEPTFARAEELIEAAGNDPQARLEALIRSVGFHMLDDQAPYRRLAQSALTQWFAQLDTPEERRTPVREGRRLRHIAMVIEPLRGQLPKKDLDRLARALGVVIGTDAMLALTDGVRLDLTEAKEAMLDAGRWLLAGALAEIGRPKPPGS